MIALRAQGRTLRAIRDAVAENGYRISHEGVASVVRRSASCSRASMRWDVAGETTRMALEGVAAPADPAAGTEAGEMPLRLIDRA